jgi:DNA (cytosine-5)-methyltransferase 1
MGLHLAGFRPVGNDLFPQPRYPFAFHQGDFRELFWELIERYRPRLVTGSPPCQGRTNAQKIQGREHPRFIAPFRELCIASGLPYMIENVPLMAGAEDLDPLKDPIMLCGTMFPGLRTRRHRLFESNLQLTAPEHPEHPPGQVKMGRRLAEGDWFQAVGNFNGGPEVDGVNYVKRNMGVPWMSRDGARECIPPVYTEYLGRQLLAQL